MNQTTSPAEAHSLTLAAWILALTGWGGLGLLIVGVDPRFSLLPIWLFYVAWLMALTGLAVPFVRYLNRRFSRAPVPATVMLRQSLWVGFLGATCAWLQKNGLLSVATAALVAAGLGGVEWFLRMRERSRWTPDTDEPA